MAQTPTGTKFFIVPAANFATAKTFNDAAITNAAEAVISMTAHGFTSGEAVLVASGWGNLNNRVFEVTVVDVNSFKLGKADTSNTQLYPAGSGGGSVRKITSPVQLSKVMNPQSQGGDPKTVEYKFVESDVSFSVNDGFSATSYSMEFDDDDTTAGYAALRTLTEVQSDTVLKMLLRNGSRVYVPCRVALNDVPSLTDGQINRIKASFNGIARHTRYSA